MSGFKVRAFALKLPRATLERYLDVRSVYRGDLYYIQNLCAVLDAVESGPEVEPVRGVIDPSRSQRGDRTHTGWKKR
jgi:hypothetical protein